MYNSINYFSAKFIHVKALQTIRYILREKKLDHILVDKFLAYTATICIKIT